MSLNDVLQRDRRLVILRTLSEMQTYSLNEGVLRQALDHIGHPEASKEIVREDLNFLERHTLVRIEKLPMPSGELWVAKLLDDGLAVANGRAHEGIARRTPGA